jgi:hypothetical protein
LAAEGAGEVGALTLLEKNNANQHNANNNVNRTHKPDHGNLNRWCGRGDLNPHASRRHPLKMVCLPISPLPRLKLLYFQRVAENTEGLSTSVSTIITTFCTNCLSGTFPLRRAANWAKSVLTTFA